MAQPIAAPPTATALASTVDIYYELPNSTGELRPGARVSVELPLATEDEARVLPWSAVVHDINGGAWVYERTAPQTFVRRRVQIRFVEDGQAILDQGPAAGAEIVNQGAYGTLWRRVRLWEVAHDLARHDIAATSRARDCAVVYSRSIRRTDAWKRRRWTCFPSSRRRWSKSRPKRPAYRPKRSKA